MRRCLDLSSLVPSTVQDRPRCATAKSAIPRRLITREKKKKAKGDQGKRMRDEVWSRDGGRCRATGVTLKRYGTTDDKQLGEVDHSYLRSLAPERIYDPSNGVLLQKFLNRLRKVPCKDAPEFKRFDYTGPDNRGLPQTFTWRNDAGRVTKTHVG